MAVEFCSGHVFSVFNVPTAIPHEDFFLALLALGHTVMSVMATSA